MTSSDPVPRRLRSAAPDGSAAPPPIDPARVQTPPAALAPQEPPTREIGRWVIGVSVLALVVLVVPLAYLIANDRTPRYTPEPVHNVTYWYTATGGSRDLDLEITYLDENGEETATASSLTPVWRKDTRSSETVNSLSFTVQPPGLNGRRDTTLGPIPPRFTLTCGIDVDGRSAAVQQHTFGCILGVSLPVKSLGPSALAPTGS
jgi:hypothetical protein